MYITIDTSNAAFGEDDDLQDAANECARILEHIAKRLRQGVHGGACTDINGNNVGRWELES